MPKIGDYVECILEDIADLRALREYALLKLRMHPTVPVLVAQDGSGNLREGTYFVEVQQRIPRNQGNPNHSAGYIGRLVCGL